MSEKIEENQRAGVVEREGAPAMTSCEPMRDGEPMRLRINTERWDTGERSGVLALVGDALRTLPGIDIIECHDTPRQCVARDGAVIALLDDYDDPDSTLEGDTPYARFIETIDPPLIIRQQLRRGALYPRRTLSGGLLIPSHRTEPPTREAERTIDVIARMRVDEYRGAPREADHDWMDARREVVKQAMKMAGRGYASRWGRAEHACYSEELARAKIGFNWQGFGRLTYRIVEYLRAGVVMITQPLGDEWPVREDVVLEDGITCIFCDRPDRFAREAGILLRDVRKLERIRRSALELWHEKLTLREMGVWYRRAMHGRCGV